MRNRICEELQSLKDEDMFSHDALELAQAIHRVLWNSEQGQPKKK